MPNPLTEKEKILLGKPVVCIKACQYPFIRIERGTKGVICDFGAVSNDPCIRWSEDFSGFITWNCIEII